MNSPHFTKIDNAAYRQTSDLSLLEVRITLFIFIQFRPPVLLLLNIFFAAHLSISYSLIFFIQHNQFL